jgi:MYXO-CTERM domain-containing protein
MDRLLRASAISASVALAVATAPVATASAQARSGQTAVGSTSLAASYEAPQRREDGFDPGWFGLLGLAGLFGLRRPREETTTRVDATPVTARRP